MGLEESFFHVHQLRDSLEEVATGNRNNTCIYELLPADLKNITKKNGWLFNWKQEYRASQRKCYKLVIENSEEIQGIVSIEDEITHLRVHSVESAPFNFGNAKKYRGVLQSLIAFACKRSYDYGYDGVIIFMAKTKLIPHYEKELNAIHIGNHQMVVYEEQARKLVSLYFKNFAK